MDISKALKELRKQTVFTQKEFADKLGITQTYLSLLESGKKTPSMDLVQVYSQLMKMPLAVILWRSVNEKDVHPSKKKAFKELKPLVDNLISQMF